MAFVIPPEPSLLIAGVTHSNLVQRESIMEILSNKFGDPFFISDDFDFDAFTDYYEKEMGPHLYKFFASFLPLEGEDNLKKRKIESNDLESLFLTKDGKRSVNIDPGYLSLSRIVLASTKNFSHRIYLGEGIFGEVTLIYKKGKFHPLEWTYPDYQSDFAQNFFLSIRDEYAKIVKGGI